MKKFVFILFVAIISACSSGKKSLQKGNYNEAVLKSVNRLRADPKNKNAKQTLRQAYPMALNYELKNINDVKLSSDVYKWEKVLDSYRNLDGLYDEINRSPGALSVLKPRNFVLEKEEAKQKSGEARYALGEKKLLEGTKVAAKKAYFDFIAADSFIPGMRDVKSKITEAKDAATIHVLVDQIPVSSIAFGLSNEFFQNKISEFLLEFSTREFVEFYSVSEAKKIKRKDFDQEIIIRFDDFVVGQTYMKELVEDFSRDSVILKKVGGKPIYGTVKAKLISFTKTINSSGLLDFKIINSKTNAIQTQEKFPGTFVWRNQWATYRGDDRALSDEQINLTEQQEIPPPAPQALFIEFTKPIFDQLKSKIRNFYSNY